jgi:hypothetical protein
MYLKLPALETDARIHYNAYLFATTVENTSVNTGIFLNDNIRPRVFK